MANDFGTMGRSARERIPVPALAMESIRNRSRAGRSRGRMRAVAACAALSVGALAVGATAGEKIYQGVRVWLSSDKAAVAVRSGVFLREPMAADLRKAIASATFPVVFPVGLPEGTRINMATVAPVDKPSAITISYINAATNFKASFALIDPAVVAAKGAVVPSDASGPRAAEHWTAGGEIVVVGDRHFSAAELERIKAATSAATPAESLAQTEAMLPKMVVLGGTVHLAAAERLRPAHGTSVLLEETYVRRVAGFAKRHAPLMDDRMSSISGIVYAKGRIVAGKGAPPTTVAVPAGGVRAIDAVLRSVAPGGHGADCGCEILFNQPGGARYLVWTIPSSPDAGSAHAYAVDATSFAVTPAAADKLAP